jgi:glucose/arabinose dehydrogenase
MKHQVFLVSFLLSAGLSACMEPQPAPDLTEIPSSEFALETLAEGLRSPWAVAELAENEYLITEKPGNLIRFAQGQRSEIQGLPEDILAEGQGGLLDIKLAPDFAETRELYLSYAYGTTEANGTALLRASLDGNELKDATTIFRTSPPKSGSQHFGSRIAFLPDETLILTFGDGFAFREDAQKPGTHLGKIVRLTRDGGVPQDNPFLGQDGYKPQIYSMGHRNVQGLAYDAETDTLWEHEHGPRGGDELNIIKGGENHGWPLVTKGVDYNGARISPFEEKDGFVDPVHSWVPSIAPSGLVIYRGDMFADWNGDALIGGLASRDLRRVDLENGKSVGEIDLLSDLDMRIRDVSVAADGAVLVLTDDPENGQLIRLSPK